jgi:anti-sigma factor RsiW
MDHETAIRIQAAERYVLEEFSPEERAQFEEHYFDCPECAEEVRSASIFAANAAQALREGRAREAGKLTRPAGRPGRWFWWPLVASAALNLALLAGFGLERLHTSAGLATMEPQFYQTFGVPAAARGSQPAIAVPAGAQFFGARFDLPSSPRFDSFRYQILGAKGASRSLRSLAAPGGDSAELELLVPVASLEPGDYVLVLTGQQQGNSTEIGRTGFQIPR